MSQLNTSVPQFFYGTAWKEGRTADLTLAALQAGFTAIDTANQRKHYYEEGVGAGIKRFFAASDFRRQDLFLQTKFTFARGQDHRVPYRLNDPFAKQVADSFASSLHHLNTNFIDSYVLHGPFHSVGIGDEDLESWTAMEKLVDDAQVKFLGVSNVSFEQLLRLCAAVRIKPAFVQNRCYARTGWDKQIRQLCKSEAVTYQGFSLLTANRVELESPQINAIAQRHGKTLAQTVFRFGQQVGMITLTGTTDPRHMREDLAISDFTLNDEEISTIENVGKPLNR